MAGFRAQLDARRLMKKLTVSPREESPSSDKYEKPQRGSSNVDCYADTLNKKYEELGRLLALQHLEKNVLSSVGNSEVQLTSKSSRSQRQRPKRGNSRGAKKSHRDTRRKSPAGGRQLNDDAVPGFVFVRVPQVIPEDRSLEEAREELPRSSKVRPKSARTKTRKSGKRSSKSSSRDDIRQYRISSSSFDEDEYYDHASGRFDDSSSRYSNRDEEVRFEEYNPSTGDYAFESENNRPLFVIEGEVEVTETVTYERPTKTEGARIVEVSETLSHERPRKPEEGRSEDAYDVSQRSSTATGTKSEKMVSFCEDSGGEEDTTADRTDDKHSWKYEDDFKNHKEDSLSIILENEILNELLQSPRPGLYQSNNFEKDMKQSESKGKKRKLRRKSRKEDEEFVNSKSSPDTKSSFAKTKDSPRKSDCKLEDTENPAIKLWLRRKNKLIRQVKRAERQKEKKEKLTEQKQMQERIERQVISEEAVTEWKENKKREVREKLKVERKIRKAMKKREEEFIKKRQENDVKQDAKNDDDIAQDSKTPQIGKKRAKRKKSRKSKVHPGNSEQEGESMQTMNLQKRVTYDEWLTQKRADEKRLKLKREKKLSSDPDLEGIIPSLGKQRIERATRTRGKRLGSGADELREESDQSDLPESDQKHENPFKLPGEGGDGWLKTLGSKTERPISSRSPSLVRSKDIRKTKKGRPLLAQRGVSLSSVAEDRHRSAKYAWDCNEKVQDSGCETLNSDSSNKGCPGNLADSKEENDEGIFLTESMS